MRTHQFITGTKMKNSTLGVFMSLASLATVMTLPLQEDEGDADAGKYIVEDDMRIPVNSPRLRQRGMNPNWTWPNGIVPFVIDPRFTDAERSVIANGLAEISKYSCVRFVPRVEQKTYVDIIKGTDCWSVIGYHEGAAGLKLTLQSPGCFRFRTVVHEAMHALGFYHEQNREDRDYNVVVLLDNVHPKQNRLMKEYGSVSLGVPYNVQSVMQYGPTALSSNGKHTIVSTRPHHPIDDKKVPWSDFRRVNRLYDCPSEYEAALDKLEYGN